MTFRYMVGLGAMLLACGLGGCRELLGIDEELTPAPRVMGVDAEVSPLPAAMDAGPAEDDAVQPDPEADAAADDQTLAAAPPACVVDTCPAPWVVCREAACVDGACGTRNMLAGTGCEPGVPAAAGAPQDAASAPPAAVAGADLPTWVCDGAGACVRCLLDGARGQMETDVDCGGPGCREQGALCATNQACAGDADCMSGVCDQNLALCVGASCRDEVRNGTVNDPEPDIDCGGPCLPRRCTRGQGCYSDDDCDGGRCDRPEGAERGVCCGTPCDGRCAACEPDTGACVAIVAGNDPEDECPGPTNWCDGEGRCSQCSNRVRDGDESGRDCGGGSCPPCTAGEGCQRGSDCSSCLCEDGMCVAPRCDNQVKDGCETDVDCGGPCGSSCGAGEACAFKGDCASLRCQEGACVGP